MKHVLLLASAAVALGYSHGRTKTVMVKEGKGDPFRINASDFEADQAEGGDKKYTEVKDDTDRVGRGKLSDVNVTGNGVDGEVQTTAAPSAPDFSKPAGSNTDPVDPVKNAAAPVATTPDQILVMKSTKGKTKGKFILADGEGVAITGDRAKLLKINEEGYDTEEAAKAAQTHTNPEPAPN